MSRLLKPEAIVFWSGLAALAPPVTPLEQQCIVTEAAKQHIIGWRMLGVQFEAGALEPLGLDCRALDIFRAQRRDRKAEHRQAAVALPISADAPADAQAGLLKAALALCNSARRRYEHTDHQRDQRELGAYRPSHEHPCPHFLQRDRQRPAEHTELARASQTAG